jgi:hypothetical protein
MTAARSTDQNPTGLKRIERAEKVMLGLAGLGSVVLFIALIFMLAMG